VAGSWRVELVRSGGVAGITRRSSLDSADLNAGEAAELERLLDELPATAPRRGGGADRFQYELRVTRGDRTHAVTLHEGAIPEEIRPLIDRLTRSAGS
jgi:hypothetical protein